VVRQTCGAEGGISQTRLPAIRAFDAPHSRDRAFDAVISFRAFVALLLRGQPGNIIPRARRARFGSARRRGAIVACQEKFWEVRVSTSTMNSNLNDEHTHLAGRSYTRLDLLHLDIFQRGSLCTLRYWNWEHADRPYRAEWSSFRQRSWCQPDMVRTRPHASGCAVYPSFQPGTVEAPGFQEGSRLQDYTEMAR
jgi:hypothetical protein